MKEEPSDNFGESTPEHEAFDQFLASAMAILDKVEAGTMTEAEAIKLLTELGREPDDRWARNFLLHTLHQDRLDKLTRETGVIID
jgi:hypothetical protein